MEYVHLWIGDIKMEKILVTKPSIAPYEEYAEEIKSIWDTMHITNFGPKYQKFIGMLKEKFGYEFIDCQCNGHMALQNILSTIPEGEIITTPFTFVSTTLAIKNSGHTPVFCDINEEDYNIDVSKIEELITDKTVAIVPVHVYGSPCDVDEIERIAKKHNLKVVYDAAHAFAEKINGKEIGKYGDASMFSFHATKVYNTIEGGLCVLKTEQMLEEVKNRSNFGILDGITEYDGVNSKMNEFAAAMGIVNLKYLDESIEKRKEITKIYDEALKDIECIKIRDLKDNVDYNYAYYPIFITDEKKGADDLTEYLQKHDIYPRRYFYPAISDMPIFESKQDTPIARKIAKNILCLPIYADLSYEDTQRIAGIIKEYYE